MHGSEAWFVTGVLLTIPALVFIVQQLVEQRGVE
jgi:hypothetical protein